MPDTSPLGWPYMNGSDAASTLAGSVKATVLAIDSTVGAVVADTGWQTLTVNSPYAALSANPPMWRLRNGVVWVKGAITNAGISAGVLMTGVATLPVGSRPIGPCFFAAPSSSAGVIGEWSLSNSGTAGGIDIRTNAAVGSYYFLSPITFIADA